MRRGKQIKPPGVNDPIGKPILREVGSHDTTVRHGLLRARIYQPCEKCGALPGERCLNLNMLPTRVFMIGFHAGRSRKAPAVKPKPKKRAGSRGR
jgi:hypothetical protein